MNGNTETLQHEDIKRLQSVLAYVRDVLTWVTTDSGLLPDAVRQNFEHALPEVQRRIDSVKDELDAIRENEERWQQLTTVGMTGEQLKMKVGVLRYLLDLKSPLKRILEWINSILGSLAKLFPGLDLVKEYKEQVEIVVEHQHGDGPEPGVQPTLGV